MQSGHDAVDATAKLVEILDGLDSEQRRRAISAALVLLGDSAHGLKEAMHDRPRAASTDAVETISPKAKTWASRNSLSLDQLEHVFAIDEEGVDIIAAKLPGKSKRSQTIAAYILCGLASYVENGDPSFTDEAARSLCRKLGAYDSPNHFNYVKGLGNLVTGSKDSGWKLTNPGLAHAAEIIRQLTPLKND